jgi:hypothetical protein
MRNPLERSDPQMPTLQWLALLHTMLPPRLSCLLQKHFRYLQLGPDAGTCLSAFHAGFPVLVLDYLSPAPSAIACHVHMPATNICRTSFRGFQGYLWKSAIGHSAWQTSMGLKAVSETTIDNQMMFLLRF